MIPAAEKDEAFRRLEAVYIDLDGEMARTLPALGVACRRCGTCCDFGEATHQLWASTLEVDLWADRMPPRGPVDATRCPHWVEGRCEARSGRPLGCRVYYCDPAWQAPAQVVHEAALGRIRRICEELGIDWRYGRALALLEEARRAGAGTRGRV